MPPFAPLLVVFVMVMGCSWRDDLDGQRSVPEGAAEQPSTLGAPPKPDVVAIDLHASRPLMAGYRRGSLQIDVGSVAFGSYIDGGIRSDWHRGLTVSGRSASAVAGLAAELYFPLDHDEGGVALTGDTLQIRFDALPAVDKQLVSVFLNEHKLSDLRMKEQTWQSYTLSAPRTVVREGENRLRFYFRSTGELAGHKSAAAFSSFTIGASLSDEVAFQVTHVSVAGSRRSSLQTNAESRISAHILVPNRSCRLRFSVSGEGQAKVYLRGHLDKQSRQVWSEPASKEAWAAADLPLDTHRGQLLRVDLLSSAAVSWSRVRVSGCEAPQKAPTETLLPPDHILLWSVASLRSDRLRSPVGDQLRRFVDTGYSVSEWQASVPASGGAHATAMTGRLRVRASIPESYQTTAEALRRAGYATALISGNGFVNDSAGYAQGFDHYDNPMRRQHHYGARTLWRQASRFLDAHRSEKTFVHIVTVEPHVPYRPSAEALARQWVLPPPFSAAKTISLGEQIRSGKRVMSSAEQGYIRALYDATVADLSAAFADMQEALKELDLPGHTAIILSGDHGEEMWERGTFGHGASLYQESLRSPLSIQYEGLEGKAPPRYGSSQDLHPTILDLAGLPVDPSVQGLSLLGDESHLNARPIIAGLPDGSRSVRLGRYKLIRHASGQLELFDLEADPAEHKDMALERAVATRALRVILSTSVAYEAIWSTARWGQVSSPSEAFARDVGM